MTQEAVDNQARIQAIKKQYINGEITYNEAAELMAPVIKRINERGAAIAKKHGLRPQNVSFAAIMR